MALPIEMPGEHWEPLLTPTHSANKGSSGVMLNFVKNSTEKV